MRADAIPNPLAKPHPRGMVLRSYGSELPDLFM
jgi:hypothetical protein